MKKYLLTAVALFAFIFVFGCAASNSYAWGNKGYTNQQKNDIKMYNQKRDYIDRTFKNPSQNYQQHQINNNNFSNKIPMWEMKPAGR